MGTAGREGWREGGGVISGSSRLSVRVIDVDEELRLSRRNYVKFDRRLVKGRAGAPRPGGQSDSCSEAEKQTVLPS